MRPGEARRPGLCSAISVNAGFFREFRDCITMAVSRERPAPSCGDRSQSSASRAAAGLGCRSRSPAVAPQDRYDPLSQPVAATADCSRSLRAKRATETDSRSREQGRPFSRRRALRPSSPENPRRTQCCRPLAALSTARERDRVADAPPETRNALRPKPGSETDSIRFRTAWREACAPRQWLRLSRSAP